MINSTHLNKKTKNPISTNDDISINHNNTNKLQVEKFHSTLNYDENYGDWIIDTDPGIDDAFALTLGINLLRDKLKLISIQSGNVGLNQCFVNAKKLCVINNRKVNISKGDSFNLSCLNLKCFSSIHGVDGFFDIESYRGWEEVYDSKENFINKEDAKVLGALKKHSAIEIIKLIKEYDCESKKAHSSKRLNILTLGPLTNLALALMLDPTIVGNVHRLVVMGGSYNSFGNIKPNGEFNFACDVIAAKKVLSKFTNIDIYCWEPSVIHLIYPEHLKINEDSKEKEKAKFITHCVNKKMEGLQGGVYADYGAAVVAFFPVSIIGAKELYCDISIDCEDYKQGRLLASEKNIFQNKKKIKHRVIEKVDMGFFHGLFNKMINEN